MGALLDAAVRAVGGTQRAGQILMAKAVHRAISTGEHLAVQTTTVVPVSTARRMAGTR